MNQTIETIKAISKTTKNNLAAIKAEGDLYGDRAVIKMLLVETLRVCNKYLAENENANAIAEDSQGNKYQRNKCKVN